MWIKTQEGNIVNTDTSNFIGINDTDIYCIFNFDELRHEHIGISLGTYKNPEKVLDDIYQAIDGGKRIFNMPETILYEVDN